MKAKILYQIINRNQGYYELTIKETEKSYIVIERTNWQGGYDKEIRFRKDTRIKDEIDYVIKNDDTYFFVDNFVSTRENGCYWQSWRQIY